MDYEPVCWLVMGTIPPEVFVAQAAQHSLSLYKPDPPPPTHTHTQTQTLVPKPIQILSTVIVVGSFMLLDSFDEASRGSSFLKSPTFSSGGCLLLTFFYTLHGVSDDAALKIYAAPPGKFLGLLKGTPPPQDPPSRRTLE